MATEVITGNTELVATKQALISSLIQKELKFKSKLLPTVTDLSAFAVKGAKSISFPKLTSFTVANRASAVAGDIQALTSAVDTLDLNINAYVSFLIDSFDMQQTAIDAEMEYANRAAAALARYVDTQIISVLDSSAYLDVGASPITADLILDAREQLIKSFADPASCAMIVGPDQEKAMLKITDFVRADQYGNNGNVASGIIGSVYGLPVLVHQGVSAGKAYWYSKDAVGIAFQKQITMAEQSEIAYGTGAKRVALDAVMGIKALQTGELGAGAGLSPLIVKM